uniref:Translocation and assembly module TamB C-terminal domain-containing protein n=1 Tax=Desulfobacca acetoxidans TaxID=60893 RepID=A0A7C3SJJ0_9BACT
MPRWRSLLFALLLILLLAGFAGWRLLQSDLFWQWAGRQLLARAQKQMQGSLVVREIRGNPMEGLFFQGITVSLPEGEVLTVKSLEVRLSLCSALKLQPVVGKLVLLEPRLNLEQDERGRWNVSRLWGPEEKPAPGKLFFPLRSLSFPGILIRDGEVNLIKAGKQIRGHDLDLALALSIDRPFTPEQTIAVSQATATGGSPWGRFALDARLSYGDRCLQVDAFTLAGEQARVLFLSGKADLARKPEDIRFSGELGPLPGQALRRFWDRWPEGGNLEAVFRLQGDLGQMQLEMAGRVHRASYQLKGTLAEKAGKWHYDAALDLEDLKPETIAAFSKAYEDKIKELSSLSLHLRATGVGLGWPPEQFAYTLEGKPFTYGKAQFEKLKAAAEGNARQQSLEVTVSGNFGQAVMKSRGSFLDAPAGEISLQSKSLRPDLLGLRSPEGTSLNGQFSGTFSLTAVRGLKGLKVAGEVEAFGQIGRHPLHELRGRLTWQKPDLSIPQARLRLGNMEAELRGALKGERVDFVFRGRSRPGGNWPIPASVGGQLVWEGSLKERVSDPAWSLKAGGRRLSYKGCSLQSFSMTAAGRGWLLRTGYFDVQGTALTTPIGIFTQVAFRGKTEAERWAFILTAVSPKGPRLEMAGSANHRVRPVEVTLNRGSFRLQGISGQNRTPVRIRFLPGFELQPAVWAINDGRIAMEAKIRGTEASGRLEAQDLPLELAGLKDLQGKLQAGISLAGTPAAPVLQGEIGLERGQWRGLGFAAVKTTLGYREALLELRGELTGQAGARLQWQGRLPLRFSLSPWQFFLPDEELSGRLQGQGINLNMLTALIPEVEKAEAPLEITAEVKGRRSNPEVFGRINWGAGFITARQAGARYRLEPGLIDLCGNKIIIPRIALTSEGTAVFQGEVTCSGFRLQDLRAQAQFREFKVLDRRRTEVFLDGAVSMEGPWTGLAVAGRLTIPRAIVDPQLFRIGKTEIHKDIVPVRKEEKVQEARVKTAGESDLMKGMRIALAVAAPNNVWVREKRTEVELALDLRIQKNPGEPMVVGGTIRSLQGTVELYGKTFKLVQGMVGLPGKPGLKPFIQARALHEMWDVTLILNISGTPDRPQFDLSSEPSLPKSEILSYLVFGRPTGALSREEFSTANLAAGAVGGFTAQKIREILGPDFPLLGDIALKGETLGIVKPLTKGITVSLGREISPVGREAGFQARLQYRVNRNITVEAQTGANPGGDIFFNYDF